MKQGQPAIVNNTGNRTLAKSKSLKFAAAGYIVMGQADMSEESRSSDKRPISERMAFWVLFLTISLVVGGFVVPGYLQRRAAGQTVELLGPLLASDTRFSKVTVSRSTNGRVFLNGSVSSDQDATALRQLVEGAHPPQMPAFNIQIAGAAAR